MLATAQPFPQFYGLNGEPLDSGSIYYGTAGQNPETNPITVYWDAAGTQPAAQPIPTLNGYPVRSGTPAAVYASADYSLTVRDKNGRLILSVMSSAALSNDQLLQTQIDNLKINGDGLGADSIPFLQSGTGAVSRTIRSKLRDMRSVIDFGAVGDGVADDTTKVQAALDSFGTGYQTGIVYLPPGNYKLTAALTKPANVSILGVGGASILTTTSDGIVVNDNATIGGSFIKDINIVGTSATSAFAGIKTVPGTDATKWLQGLILDGVVIDSFGIGLNAKNLRHATIIGVKINRCATGIQFRGQCVSNNVHSCKIVRNGGAYNDGSIGIEAVASTEYSDAVSRQPEAIRITGETLVYGYDTNVYFKNGLACSVEGCDIDAALQYGVRAAGITGGLRITGNYIGAIHQPTAVVKAIYLDDLASPLNTPVVIRDNHLQFYSTTTAGSTGCYVGTNRTGVMLVAGNMLGGGSGAAIALSLASSNVKVKENFIYGTGFSLVTSAGATGHRIDGNQFVGTVLRDSASKNKDRFTNNYGVSGNAGAVFSYYGPVTISAGNTTQTIPITSLGYAGNIDIATNAHLQVLINAYQFTGTVNRGNVRARYDGAGNFVVDVATSVGLDSADVWLEVEFA